MLKAARPLDRLFTAFRASLVSLHAELIFPLPGDRQIRELIFDPFSHFNYYCINRLLRSEINFTYFRPGTHGIIRTYLWVRPNHPDPKLAQPIPRAAKALLFA